ncbi:MAG: hypothetical protein ACRD4P_05850 [Bryobacteraceae bacterium]
MGFRCRPIGAREKSPATIEGNYFFGAHDENRIEFTKGRDLILTPEQTYRDAGGAK